MKHTATPKESDAYHFVEHLYRTSMSATGHSWTRLNGCLYQAVFTAIEAGLSFDVDDFGNMMSKMNGGYWFHDGGPERWYAAAVKHGNASAWKALEKYLNRKPFILEGKRVVLGDRLQHGGKMIDVTSFSNDDKFVLAVLRVSVSGDDYRQKVAKRYKFDREQLKKLCSW